MMHFSRSITQYRSRHSRFHRKIRSPSRRRFSHSISRKSTNIALFSYLTCFSPICNALRATFPQRNIYFRGFNSSSHQKAFSDPQQGHEYSRILRIYVEIFQTWTSYQKNEVLNIVQGKKYQKYPHFEDFFVDERWLKFRIFYHISTPWVGIYG